MKQQDIYHNCRNCNMRFKCTEKTEHGFCDDYVFDDGAATCDDCAKKEKCKNYIKNKPTCIDWEPEMSCDECSRQESCKNYTEGGKTCKKFKEIIYRLTEKGCLYLAMNKVQETEKTHIGIENLFKNGFFEKLDHEMRINGLISEYNNIFEKILNNIKFKIFKPKKSAKEIFFNVAERDEFFDEFGLSYEIVEKVYEKFFETLEKQYKN